MYKLFTFLLVISILCPVLGQNSQHGFCGTSTEDQFIIRERMFKNRADLGEVVYTKSGAIRYIPITYHLVAKNDKSGRLRVGNVFTNLCAINRIYEDQEVQFYIKNINFVNNDFLYDNPSSALGAGWATSIANSNRNAVNIFCASVANRSELGVLAFYNPGGDYIVSGNAQVSSNGTTLAHEIGHFFSLAHTFYGWEGTTYSCNVPTPSTVTINGTAVQVEYVARDKRLNGQLVCKIAADGFCDTQADYNLGFGWNGGCVYTGCAKDQDNAPLDPDERNIMSYFLNCLEYFSAEQKAAILRDYNSSARNYLRSPVYSPLQDVTGAVSIIGPSENSTTEGFNIVKLEWLPVNNATHYFVEIGEGSISQKTVGFITKRTDTTLTSLVSNKRYFWRVFAYNPNSFCHTQPNPISFVTGKFAVSTRDLSSPVEKVNWIQSETGEIYFVLDSDKYKKVHVQFFDLSGRVLRNFSKDLIEGSNTIQIEGLMGGTYLYKISDETSRISGKLVLR